MNRIILISIIIAILSLTVYSQQTEYIEGELLVQFERDVSAGAVLSEEPFAGMNVEVKRYFPHLNVWYVSYDDPARSDQDVLSAFKDDPRVVAAQFNHVVTKRGRSVPNDPMFNQQWSLNNTGQTGGTPGADIDALAAWNITTGEDGVTALGDEIVVAVVDGGAALGHPDLNYTSIMYNAFQNSENPADMPSSSHGAHVAGIIGAVGNNNVGVTGVSWNTKILPIAGSSGQEAIVVAAYDWALGQRKLYNDTDGAQGKYVVATNSSFGVNFGNPANFPLWCAAYDSLGVHGVLSTAATMNSHQNVDVVGDVPTGCPSQYLISVTNTTHNDLKNTSAAYGLTTIELGAPGTSILNTVTGNGYSTMTGTSMAAPHVAGAIALVYSGLSESRLNEIKNNPAAGVLHVKARILNGVDPLDALDGITVTGGRLNVFKALLEPDTIAPAPITDLQINEVFPFSVELEWTATGASGDSGTASSYDLRYSTAPITAENFNSATQVSGLPSPAESGETETFTVTDLTHSTTYYFALKAVDIWMNWSDISNVVSATTQGAPQVFVNPDSLEVWIGVDETTTKYITIGNTGEGTLQFQISFASQQINSALESLRTLDANDADLVRFSRLQQERFGGREGEVTETERLAFEREVPASLISGTRSSTSPERSLAKEFLMENDDFIILIDEDFSGTFPPAGWQTTSTGGNVNWQQNNSNLAGGVAPEARFYWLPSTTALQRMITPVLNTTGIHELTVEFKHFINNYASGTPDYELSLQTSADGGDTWMTVTTWPSADMPATTEEILLDHEHGVGSDEFMVAWVFDGYSWDINWWNIDDVLIYFYLPWLSVDPASGNVPQNETMEIAVIFDSEGIEEGTYNGNLVVKSNDPDNSEVIRPVTMHVTSMPPVIAVTPESFEEEVYAGSEITRTLMIRNLEGILLHFNLSSQEATGPEKGGAGGTNREVSWISFEHESGSVSAGDTARITVTFDASELTPDIYTADIVVSSNDPANSEVLVPVEFSVEELPLPSQVSLVSPVDGESIEVLSDSLALTMKWHSSGPHVTFYELDIATDAAFSDMVYTGDELTDTSYVFTAIEDQQTYYWRVRAENGSGRGEYSDVWSFMTIVVGVDEQDIPAVYSLMQNYPNPFNPSTTIRYGLPERSTVKLEIYNTLGQRVATLINEQLEAGYHDVEWYSGRAASGMYFYRLEAVATDNPANRFIEVKSMMLVK